MVDPGLMRGAGWVRCCICGRLHEAPYPFLFRDVEGELWDLCNGTCAMEEGEEPEYGPATSGVAEWWLDGEPSRWPVPGSTA